MKQVVTCQEMKSCDSYTIEKMGVPSCVLMERAALKVVEELEKRFTTENIKQKILCVCGSGNNGGDGVAIARILHQHGYQSAIYLAGNPDHRTEEMQRQCQIAVNYQVPVVNNLHNEEYTTIVDAIFGVGLTREVKGEYRELIAELNEMSGWKVAVDLPSGVDGDTGIELGIAFCADLTVTFAFRKAGLCLYPGRKLAGQIVVADVGIYREDGAEPKLFSMEKSDLRELPEKEAEGNKGTFGKVLVVAGIPGMCGAAFLSASGAFATGAGMVKIITPEENRIPLQTMLPEAMISCTGDWENDFNWSDVLVIGPGIGMTVKAADKVRFFLKKAKQEGKPVVLDADGLNLLAENPEWKKYLGSHVILTPHMGEMSRLTGKSIRELKSDRAGAARALVAETGAVCVLKDACTVTAAPDGRAWINLLGNAGMATAGSGDVLSGVLAGMQAMYLETPIEEKDAGFYAALGTMLHGAGGDQAALRKGMAGMKAGDVACGVAEILKEQQNFRK